MNFIWMKHLCGKMLWQCIVNNDSQNGNAAAMDLAL